MVDCLLVASRQHQQPTEQTNTMTKAQVSAALFINQSSRFQWDDLVAHIKKKHIVKNWMPIRAILQFHLNDGEIVKTQSPFIEEYTKIK